MIFWFNNIDRHDMTEIALKVASNTINQTKQSDLMISEFE